MTTNESPTKQTYANVLKPKSDTINEVRLPLKPVLLMDDEPSITWKSSEIQNLILQENLQFSIIGNFIFMYIRY